MLNEFENKNKIEDQNDKNIKKSINNEIPNRLLFEVVFRFLAANWIKIWIDNKTFKVLKDIYESDKPANVRQDRLLEEIKGFPAEDHTKSSIKEEDYNIAVEIIFNNFAQIRKFWNDLSNGEGLVVVTDGDRAWGSSDMNVKPQTKSA